MKSKNGSITLEDLLANENTKKHFMELTANAMLSRTQLIEKLLTPRRDIDTECDYPSEESLDPAYYRQLFDRNPIGNRVVELFPTESWSTQPEVYETSNEEEETAFEKAWKELPQALNQGSFFKDENSNPVWETLLRADIASGIGRFGIILLGVADGRNLHDPLPGYEDEYNDSNIYAGLGTEAQYDNYEAYANNLPTPKTMQLLYMRVYDESLLQISRFESRPNHPRFGLPVEYLVTINRPEDYTGGLGLSTQTVKVHWSRCIHLADNILTSEIISNPRMKTVVNNILDLRKIYASSAEGYWQSAFTGMSLESEPGVEIDVAAAKEQIQNYMNRLQRWLGLSGITAKTLSPEVNDPASQIEVQLDAICIKLGCPKRIFIGSERGELSSTQDKDTWDERMESRQKYYITPRIIVPLVDRLITSGVLPKPKQFSVHWEPKENRSKAVKATTAVTQVQALAGYIAGGVDALLTPMDLLTKVIGFDQDEADSILENVNEYAKERNPALEAPNSPANARELPTVDEIPTNQARAYSNALEPLNDTNPVEGVNGGSLLDVYRKAGIVISNVFCPTGKGGVRLRGGE